MPHSDPKTNELVRHNGHYTLSILAPKGVGLPYGRYPRLVLAYPNTEAVKRRTRHIELDHHFSHFCAALGILPTTGPRGSLPQLREQMQRLFASTFQCVFHDEEKGRHAGDGFLIAEKRALCWDPRREAGDASWGSHVVLSERFFRLRRPVTIPWASLQPQFGCGYKDPRHFKRRFLEYLKSVVSYYPEARLTSTFAGLLLKPSATHVAPRAIQRPVTDRRSYGKTLRIE